MSAEGPAGAGVQHFDMSASDPERRPSLQWDSLAASSTDGATVGLATEGVPGPGGLEAGEAVVTEAPSDLAAQIRERFQYLSHKDQQTVCRRQCELAQKREEALKEQVRTAIGRFQYALQLSQVVEDTITPEEQVEEDLPKPAISPELAAKYEERICLLQSLLDALAAEPVVSLPKLTALEQAKGAWFASYAHTAVVARKLGSTTNAGASGARAAFSSFTSRWGGYLAAPAGPPDASDRMDSEVPPAAPAGSPGAPDHPDSGVPPTLGITPSAEF